MAKDFSDYVELDRIENRLVPQLKNLITDYELGVSLFKEFVQNADDAGATSLHFRLDLRRHRSEKGYLFRPLLGPSLLVHNNAVFSKEDRSNLKKVAESEKRDDLNSIGKFGVGFNNVYAITDYPSLLSAGHVTLYDPHPHITKRFGESNTAINIALPNFWSKEEFKPWANSFVGMGLEKGVESYPETIFRLPLRDVKQAELSEINKEPCSTDKMKELLEQLADIGSEFLLFAKNLLDIRVDVIPKSSKTEKAKTLVEVVTSNPDAVKESRTKIYEFLRAKTFAEFQEKLSESGSVESQWTHMFRVKHGTKKSKEKWLISQCVTAGPEGVLTDTSAKTRNAGKGTAPPLAGTAVQLCPKTNVPIPFSSDDESKIGKLFCGLPIGKTETTLPVHINGMFALGSGRTALSGSDGIEAEWNQGLFEHAVSQSYISLLNFVKEVCGVEAASKYYELWPNSQQCTTRELKSFVDGFSTRITQQDKTIAGIALEDDGDHVPQWICPEKILTPMVAPQDHRLKELLIEEGVPQPYIAVPSHVREYLKESLKFHVGLKWMASHFKTPKDFTFELSSSQWPSIKANDDLKIWLRFAIALKNQNSKKGDVISLHGLPFAKCEDGLVRNFGECGWANTALIATTLEKEILHEHQHLFLDHDLYKSCLLSLIHI